MINQEIIEEVKRRLVEEFNPVEIYIFGSYAWGSPDEESDLDLAIVVDSLDDRYREMVKGHKALTGLQIGKDILIYTKQEFEEDCQNNLKFCYKIKKKGKKIYARA